MTYLALFLSLPTKATSERTKFWRSLKAIGSVALRDGVYLLPDTESFQARFEELAKDAEVAGGTADIFRLSDLVSDKASSLQDLFIRDQDYAELEQEIKLLGQEINQLDSAAVNRRLQSLNRKYEQIFNIDFFQNNKSANTKSVLEELEEKVRRYNSPDEPKSTDSEIPRCNLADYQKRIWATRARPWVDRLASAWLIRRFIDTQAEFKWLASPKDCQANWLGFDFDGARFTHVGNKVASKKITSEKVTFETLLASFNLTNDPALVWLGDLVHSLDVGGIHVPEASGVEAMLAGLRASQADDDQLLSEAEKLFDWLLENRKHK